MSKSMPESKMTKYVYSFKVCDTNLEKTMSNNIFIFLVHLYEYGLYLKTYL